MTTIAPEKARLFDALQASGVLTQRLPSPDTQHVHNAIFRDSVYDVAEDTFYFLDILQRDIERLVLLDPTIVVEVGPGSGCIGVFLLQLYELIRNRARELYHHANNNCNLIPAGQPECPDRSNRTATATRQFALPLTLDPFVVSIDINSAACQASRLTANANGLRNRYDTAQASLLSCLRRDPTGVANLILFNPPYVATSQDELRFAQETGSISASWAGGAAGHEIIDQFLGFLPESLSDCGICYLLSERTNDKRHITRRCKALNLVCEDVGTEKRCNEEFTIWRISKLSDQTTLTQLWQLIN